jgi:hypothetical protein
MFASFGSVVVFVAENEAILPVPLAANQIAVFLFVHAKVAPAVGLVKLVVVVFAALQITTLLGTATVGVGFTVIE